MFAAWGSWVARFRWPVFAVTLAAVIAAGVWGLGVFGQLTEGGYNDPGSESTRAAEAVQAALGAQGGDVVVIYTPAPAADRRRGARPAGGEPAGRPAARRGDARADLLLAGPGTAVRVGGQAQRGGGADPGRRRTTAEKLASYREIDDRLAVEGARTQVAGARRAGRRVGQPVHPGPGGGRGDLAADRADPAAAHLRLAGRRGAAGAGRRRGGARLAGRAARHRAAAHDVNSFAVNVASLLGLGMAIDYGLFMVGRFREEQSHGRTPADAVTRTVATAGRTVLFSATLLMIALAGLLLFPQGFLKSLAYGGLAAVGAGRAALADPAARAARHPRPARRPAAGPPAAAAERAGRPAPAGRALADVVLRRPVLVALPILAGLLVLAAPIRGRALRRGGRAGAARRPTRPARRSRR